MKAWRIQRKPQAGFELATLAWWFVSFSTLVALTHLFLKERQINLKDIHKTELAIEAEHQKANRRFVGGIKNARKKWKKKILIKRDAHRAHEFVMDFSEP